MWSVMNSGPVAQFKPTARRFAWDIDTQKASTACPASMVPIASMVPETTTGIV